ncbi:Sulfotransferase domain protein [compost metagenome]
MHNAPIIVGGFYRSGTSLIRRLLDSHSRIYCGPEVKFLKDFYGEYIGDDLAHARLFSTVRSSPLSEHELLRIFGRAFIEFHTSAAARSGKIRWADKNPENVIHLKDWELLLSQGFLFVHVVRDPRDALTSVIEAGFPRAVPANFDEKVVMYERFRVTGEQYCRENPERCFQIEYEDIVRDPDATLSRLFEFLGEVYEPDVKNRFFLPERRFGIEDPKVQTTRAIHTASVGRWRSELTEDQLAKISERLLPYFYASASIESACNVD